MEQDWTPAFYRFLSNVRIETSIKRRSLERWSSSSNWRASKNQKDAPLIQSRWMLRATTVRTRSRALIVSQQIKAGLTVGILVAFCGRDTQNASDRPGATAHECLRQGMVVS